MNIRKIGIILPAMVLYMASIAFAQGTGKRAITFDDLISLDRVGDVQISPDGKWVAYTVGTPDKAANRTVRNIWLVATSGTSAPVQLTRSGRDLRPRWSPDGSKIAFLSSRDGAPQIYSIALDGGEAMKLTSISTGAENVLWSPDGKNLSFTSEVYPDCADDSCNSKRDAEREKSKVKARIYDRLLYRHWDTWEDGKRSHLFVVPFSPSASLGTGGGTPRDLTPGADYDVPVFSLGGPEPIAFSPDGAELCFTANADKVEATSTNADLFVVPVSGSAAPRPITTNPAYDGGPAYAPDGKFIAYHAQFKAGYESDRWRLMLYERKSGQSTNLSEGFDRSVDAVAWSADSQTILFNYEDQTLMTVAAVAASPGAEPKPVLKDGYHGEFAVSRDGKTIVFTRASLAMPAEVFATNSDGSSARQLTRHNAERMAKLDLREPEKFWFPGAGGTQIHAMLLRPPAFDPGKKYPLLLLAHGGPQTMWSDTWSYRWNAQVMASPGYAVLMINRRGSTGFGQKLTDEIVGDYGGKAFEDLMKGVDYVLAKYAFVDGSRMAAAGGSYGGFMMNWFASQSKGRFKAIITHASIFNQVSMYGATEELWFMEWDQQGTPWANPEGYRKWSPGTYAADFGKYKTPTLVIHGEQDYRVPYTEGLQMFTALQRQGVPSKLLLYPDEGHWIGRPQNSELWYKTFLDWLAQWLK